MWRRRTRDIEPCDLHQLPIRRNRDDSTGCERRRDAYVDEIDAVGVEEGVVFISWIVGPAFGVWRAAPVDGVAAVVEIW